MPSITPDQIRAARAILGWKQSGLARAAGVSRLTVVGVESGQKKPWASTMDKIEAALTKAGIEIQPDGGVRRNR